MSPASVIQVVKYPLAIPAYATSSVVVQSDADMVQEAFPDDKSMWYISDCESGNGKPDSARQFRPDGSVISHKNDNGSIDYGVMQINSSHIPEAEKLGLDIMTTKGNLEMAKIIRKAQGYSAWYNCYNKIK